MQVRLLLGSASARRAKILAEMGVPFDQLAPDVNEMACADDPRGSATENAIRKHAWCRLRRPDAWILTADTVIDLAGRCIGKPADLFEARAMFAAFSGRSHDVLTAVAMSRPGRAPDVAVALSRVVFKRLDARAADEYFALVDPLDKAGGYDIDQHGERIVESYTGSRTNIMGLPRETVGEWLREQVSGSQPA